MIWALLLALQAPAASRQPRTRTWWRSAWSRPGSDGGPRRAPRSSARSPWTRPARSAGRALRPGLPRGALRGGRGRPRTSPVPARRCVRARPARLGAAARGAYEDALDEWNRLGQPRLADVRFTGLDKTRDRVARRELRFAEGRPAAGRLLPRDAAAPARGRRVPARPPAFVPRDDHRADVEVALTERHGLGSWQELAVSGVANALRRQVRLWYFNLGGEGVVLRAEYKWERTQPHVAGARLLAAAAGAAGDSSCPACARARRTRSRTAR